MREGAETHGENNYQLGVGDADFIRDRINHLIEHARKYQAGDRSDDHLAAIRANAGMLIWLEEATRGSVPSRLEYPASRYAPEPGTVLPNAGMTHVGQQGYVIPDEQKIRG